MIASEIIEDCCYILDKGGKVWCVKLGYDLQPTIENVGIMFYEEIKAFMSHRFEKFHNKE